MSQETLSFNDNDLIEYLDPDQQKAFAQKLFDHLLATEQAVPINVCRLITPKQQQQAINYIEQHPTSDKSFALLRGLLNNPNSAHQRLIPLVLQQHYCSRRLCLLSYALPYLTPNEQAQLHPIIFTNLHELLQTEEDLEFELSSEMILLITNELLQNLDDHLDRLCRIHHQQTPSEQQRISALIWQHLANNPAWPLDQLIDEGELFELCVPSFNPTQIQTALEYILEQQNPYVFSMLMPYLNAQQIQHFQILTPQMGSSLAYYYHEAHTHYQILDQASYYQTLLAALHTQQRQYRDQWDFIQHLNAIAADLHPEDTRALYLNSLNLLTTRYLEPESSWALCDAIEHFQRINFINQHTLTQFLHYASQQDRNSMLKILEAIMPLYLQTLAPEEQQQLTQQITQSVEQVSTAWP